MKTITFSLSPESIAKACNELDWYKKTIERKTKQLQKRIAERIQWSAQSGFATAVRDDLLSAGTRYADVTVTISEEGDTTVVIANGEDAVFVEFGAGVHHNGSVGQSPNPFVAENNLEFTIGSYDKGHGSQDIWGFKEDGRIILTYGTPASMPMYHGLQDALNDLVNIANEVFGND